MFDHEARIRFYPHNEFRAAEMWILSTQTFGVVLDHFIKTEGERFGENWRF